MKIGCFSIQVNRQCAKLCSSLFLQAAGLSMYSKNGIPAEILNQIRK